MHCTSNFRRNAFSVISAYDPKKHRAQIRIKFNNRGKEFNFIESNLLKIRKFATILNSIVDMSKNEIFKYINIFVRIKV